MAKVVIEITDAPTDTDPQGVNIVIDSRGLTERERIMNASDKLTNAQSMANLFLHFLEQAKGAKNFRR